MHFQASISSLVLALGVGTLAAHPAHAQNQVANYYFGQPGTASYEHFSFWTKDGRRTDIQYAYGKDRKDTQLHYAGLGRLNGQAYFKVQFPNRRILYVLPSGTTLHVAAARTATPKTFMWEYEGPVNGVGTDCSVCVADAHAAMQLLRKHYLR
jgi:hypothetical protein